MDPATLCQKLISDPPTRAGVTNLATLARSVDKVGDPSLSLAFVQASARQLPAAGSFFRDKASTKLVVEICNVRMIK